MPREVVLSADREHQGQPPEAEPVLIAVEDAWATLTLDDGEALTFRVDELRAALSEAA